METLSVYLPIDRRLELGGSVAVSREPSGSVMFADLSGFTHLAERLQIAVGQARGAEELSARLDTVYAPIVDAVHAYRGVIIEFIGDGMICLFEEDDGHRAVAAAITMQRASAELRRREFGDDPALGLKIGIDVGTSRRLVLGDPAIQRLEVLCGPPVDGAVACEGVALAGEIVVSQPVSRVARAQGTTVRPLGTGPRPLSRLELDGDLPAPRPWPAVELQLPLDAVRPWLQPAVHGRIVAGQGRFLTEIRMATVLFMRLGVVAPEQLDPVVCWVQATVAEQGGSLLGVTLAEKGSYLHAGFGAPVSMEGHASRALTAAQRLVSPPTGLLGDALDSEGGRLPMGGPPRVGLAAGRVRAGAYGSARRRTYGLLGNTVNLASRLMSRAAPGRVLVSEGVVARAAWSHRFDEGRLISLKGLARPVLAYEPEARAAAERTENLHHRHVSRSGRLGAASGLVGRQAETERLAGGLRSLGFGAGSIFVIEGDAGIGKSHLMRHLLAEARQRGLPVLVAGADPLRRTTPFHVFELILSSVLELGQAPDDPGSRRAWISDKLPADLPERELACLLGPLLRLHWPEPRAVQELSGEERARRTVALVAGLLARLLPGPLVFAVEGLHWLDTPSWQVLHQLAQAELRWLIAITTRPLRDESRLELLLALPHAHRMPLAGLSLEATAELVARRLRAARVHPAVVEAVFERASGHPFFTEELVDAALRSGQIVVEEGEARTASGDAEVALTEMPDSIDSVLTERIDSLAPDQQLTLKVASVVGFEVPLAELEELVGAAGGAGPVDVDSLEAAGLVVRAGTPDAPGIAFRHRLAQRAAYGLLLFAQRKALHETIAQRVESRHADQLDAWQGVLAHHRASAGELELARRHLDAAALYAIDAGAMSEALDYVLRAESIGDDQGVALPEVDRSLRVQRAWIRGECNLSLGRGADAIADLERCLRLAGLRVPETDGGRLLTGLREIGLQLLHRLVGRSLGRARLPQQNLVAARAAALLAPAYLGAGARLAAAVTTLRSLNLAESALPQPQAQSRTAQASAMASLAAQGLGLGRLAESYRRRALDLAERSGDLAAGGEVLQRCGLARLGAGRLAEARPDVDEAVARFRRLGDARRLDDAQVVAAWLALYQGRFRDGDELWHAVLSGARGREDRGLEAAALVGRVLVQLRLAGRGYSDLAAGLLDSAERLLEYTPDPTVGILHRGLRAELRRRDGHRDLARSLAESAIGRLEERRVWRPESLELVALPADVLLALAETDADARRDTAAIARALRLLHRFARVHPIGQARWHRCRGQLAWQQGHQRRALRLWREGRTLAVQAGMPWEAAWLRRLIARDPVLPADEGREQVAEVRAGFEALEARHEWRELGEELVGR